MVYQAKRKLLSLKLIKYIARLILRKAGEPLNAVFVLHTEMVQDDRVFEKLMRLGEWLSFRPALCVMTPRNPYIKEDMVKKNVSEAEFGRRLIELKKYYEIGFHGHWCKKSTEAARFSYDVSTRIERAGFQLTLDNPAAIEEQFKDEYEYLKEYGFKPRIYTAGWWFLNNTIVHLLDTYGFKFDCSLRYKYADTFGGRHMKLQKSNHLCLLLIPKRQWLMFYLRLVAK